MTKDQLEKIKKIIQEEEKNYDFSDYVLNSISDDDLEEAEDSDDVGDILEKANEDRTLTDSEIIYYANAMEYLAEHDNSLTESLGIAYDMGYDLKNLNSEKLASMLASENNLSDFGEFIDNVKEEIDKQEIFTL